MEERRDRWGDPSGPRREVEATVAGEGFGAPPATPTLARHPIRARARVDGLPCKGDRMHTTGGTQEAAHKKEIKLGVMPAL